MTYHSIVAENILLVPSSQFACANPNFLMCQISSHKYAISLAQNKRRRNTNLSQAVGDIVVFCEGTIQQISQDQSGSIDYELPVSGISYQRTNPVCCRLHQNVLTDWTQGSVELMMRPTIKYVTNCLYTGRVIHQSKSCMGWGTTMGLTKTKRKKKQHNLKLLIDLMDLSSSQWEQQSIDYEQPASGMSDHQTKPVSGYNKPTQCWNSGTVSFLQDTQIR